MLSRLEASAKERIIREDAFSIYDLETLCKSFNPDYRFDEKIITWLNAHNIPVIQ